MLEASLYLHMRATGFTFVPEIRSCKNATAE